MAGKKSSSRYFITRKSFFSFGTIFCIFIALALWLVINRNNLLQFFHHYGERNRERAEVKVLKKNIQDIEEQKRILSEGGFENEKIIRETYRMIKPGEKMIILEMEDEKKKK